MKHSLRKTDFVQRLCERLGRQTWFSPFLDWVASWAVPSAPRLAFAFSPAPGSAQDLMTGPMFMASGPDLGFVDGNKVKDSRKTPVMTQGAGDSTEDPSSADYVHPTVATAKASLKERLAHSAKECAAQKYQGMHGRPCAFTGGTDLKCPKDSLAGWFWRYKTPAGIYYYVDCCGKKVSGSVWCNWSSEADWCISAGWNHGHYAHSTSRSAYTCTLAIPDAMMKTVEGEGVEPGSAPGTKKSKIYDVVGVE